MFLIFCRLYFDFVLSPVFKYKTLVGVLPSHLSTLPRPHCPDSHEAKKHYLFVLFWARALQLLFLSFLSWCMQTLQRFLCTWTPMMKGQAGNVRRLNSQISQDRPFFSLPFFVLNIPLFTYLLTFSFWNFSRRLFILTYFDRSRRHTQQGRK